MVVQGQSVLLWFAYLSQTDIEFGANSTRVWAKQTLSLTQTRVHYLRNDYDIRGSGGKCSRFSTLNNREPCVP